VLHGAEDSNNRSSLSTIVRIGRHGDAERTSMQIPLSLLALAALTAPLLAALPEVSLPQAEQQLILQQRPQASPAWQAFARETGWSPVDWDLVHPFPHRAFGPALPLPGGPIRDAEDLDARLRGFLDAHPGLFSGGPKAATEAFRPLQLARHGDVWHATYTQTWRGARVLESELVFRVSPAGDLLLAGSDAHPRITAREPVLDRAQMAEQLRRLEADGLGVTRVEVEADWVLLPLLEGKSFRYEPVWPAQVDLDHPEHRYQVFASALSGEILWSWNRVRHVEVDGHLHGLVEEQQPADPDLPQPLAHLRLLVAGVEVFTAPDGAFSVEVDAPPPWQVSGELRGHYADVNREDGPDAQFSFQMNAAGETLTVGLDQAQIQELDAYLHTTRVHNFITDMDPSFTWLNEPLPVNININSTCNAYWDGYSINFFAEGGGCPNTARVAGVVYHEYGHGVNDRQYRQAGAPWGMTNGAMHEGLADVTAIYLQDESFVSPGWFIRNLDNTNRYPENIIGQVHHDGLILGGAMYDLRLLLDLDSVRPLHHFARWGTPDDPDLGRASFEYFLELLLVDDDDGDLGNLTPNYAAIDEAFNAHGIGSVLTWTGASFVLDEPPFLATPMEDVLLSASLLAPAFVVPESVELRWWAAGIDTQSVFFEDQGDGNWAGLLPGQPWNTVVSYYARVNNPAGVELITPPGAPQQAWRTRFAFEPGLLLDFEDEPLATPSNEVWQWGQPSSGPGQAYSGLRLWATNLAGNYPANSISRLSLPTQTVADDQQVVISLQHWMSIEAGWDGGNLEIAVNGGPWQLVEPLSGYHFVTPDNNALPGVPALTGETQGWERLVLDITGQVEPGDEVALRLNLLSDGLIEGPGWYIDDLSYLGFATPPQIAHQPLPDSEDTAQEAFEVRAWLQTSAVVESFMLRWRSDGGQDQTLPMAELAEGEWLAAIPGPFDQQTVEYRLEVGGNDGFAISLPAAPDEWLGFFVGPDTQPPQVAFVDPPRDAVGHSALWPVVAEAVDNLGLAAVEVQAWSDGAWQTVLALEEQGEARWEGLLDFQAGQGDSPARFRLLARDASQAANEAVSDEVEVSLGVEQLVDDFEGAVLSDWTVSGNWTVQGVRVRFGQGAMGTTADGFYAPGEYGVATWNRGIDLRQVEHPVLRLWEQYFIENGDDFLRIEVSDDGGGSWELLAERTGAQGWSEASLPLEAWIGVADLRLRFVFEADDDSDGWQIGYFADQIRLLNESTAVADNGGVQRPTAWILGEPWPNPFNPSSRVVLQLPAPTDLRLSVFNLLGQHVATIHEGPLPAGEHTLQVNGSGWGSGLYLLRAAGEGRLETRKLLLVK
jgi:hypothetical protein